MARLTAKALANFQNINCFQPASQWIVRAGDTSTLYFQVVDLDQNNLRYIAGIAQSPVSLLVTFPSIDSARVLAIPAIQNTYDPSIFSVTIPSTQVPSGGNVIFKLIEGNSAKSFGVLNLLAVEYPGADGSDGSLPISGD